MARNFMAYPELRHPFEETPIHAPGSTTVLYQGNTITLTHTGEGNGLLVTAEDLTRINGFELKPEGACYAELCVPIKDDMLVEQGGRVWFDLTAFAELIGQPYVADVESRVWSFGEIPAKRESMLVNAMAPDLEVKDRQGKIIRLADLKGKKALIVTWSSW